MKTIKTQGKLTHQDSFKIDGVEQTQFIYNYQSLNNMYDDYASWKRQAFKTNFNGNPLEQNSFICINDGNHKWLINPPVYANGDKDYRRYINKGDDKTNLFVTITQLPKDYNL